MNRRQFSSSLAMLGMAGCAEIVPRTVTRTVLDYIEKPVIQRYTETVDYILLSEDGKNLVFIGPEYHYIFDMPEDFSALLNSPLRNRLTAYIDVFYVDLEAKIKGKISLILPAPDDDKMLLGLTDRRLQFHSFDLQGMRYSAKGFDRPTNIISLQNSYTVQIDEEVLSDGKKALLILTPLTVTVDGVFILGMMPFAIIASFSPKEAPAPTLPSWPQPPLSPALPSPPRIPRLPPAPRPPPPPPPPVLLRRPLPSIPKR